MLAKKYGYYGKDPWSGYEDDWAIGHFGDIFVKDFYPLWFKDELTNEQIEGASEKFAKWNKVVENKLQSLGTNFIGGSKPSCGDFITFSVYTSHILNENTKRKDLKETLRSEMAETPAVMAWVKRMKEELKDYLANRPACVM